MVLKPSPKYGERFGKQLGCVGLLVVEKTWLMCPDKKRQLGVLAQLQIQVSQDLWESVFRVLAQVMVVKPLPRYGE
jgi:hypothetical protein